MQNHDQSFNRRTFLTAGSATLLASTVSRLSGSKGTVFQELPERLRDVRAMTFDVFGTVVDWRTSIAKEGEAVGRRHGIQADWSSLSAAVSAGLSSFAFLVQSTFFFFDFLAFAFFGLGGCFPTKL